MAQKKRTSAAGRKKTAGRTGAKRKSNQKQKNLSGEIVVLLVLAVALLLFISNFGLGGAIGESVSRLFLRNVRDPELDLSAGTFFCRSFLHSQQRECAGSLEAAGWFRVLFFHLRICTASDCGIQ